MLSREVFIVLNLISLVIMVICVRLVANKTEGFAIRLRRLIMAAAVGVSACVYVAMAPTAISAEVAFCIYFGSLDWVAFYLLGFFLKYTNHQKLYKITYWPVLIMVVCDTISIFLNLVLGHQFSVYKLEFEGEFYYQYTYSWPYILHLILDYAVIGIGFITIVIAMFKSVSFYKIKYICVFSVVSVLIALNMVYLAFSMPLDWSVTFYAFGSMLIYYYSIHYTPQNLIGSAIKRATNEMNEGLIMFDLDNNCIYINEFIRKYFGIMDISECKIDSIPMQTIVVGDDIGNVDDIKQIVVEGKDGNRDERFRVHFSRLKNKKNKDLGAYFRLERITDEYENMILLKNAREEANRANKAKSDFLANMSHEIRTPINSILGMNEMVIRECDDEQIVEYAQNIQSAGNSLLGLINDILDFSKVEAGKMDLVIDTYNIHKILRDALHMLESRAIEKGLKLDIVCDENIPMGLSGDENRIRQIITNIVTNGIKYTKEGGVTVKVECDILNDDEARLVFEISDTGIGISEENMATLFNAFHRVDEGRNRNIEGTGLGLAITKQLLALMDGDVFVESEVNKGSVFTVIIPQGITDKKPVGKFSRTIEVKKNGYKESFTAPTAKVLVVDDVPMNIKVVQALLKKTQINIDTTTNGNEAFEMCKNKKYDVILMDHMMPEPDGIATLKMIREEGLNKDSCVIVLTANAINGVEKEYLEVGFADYMSKPVKGEVLEKMLMKYLPKDKLE